MSSEAKVLAFHDSSKDQKITEGCEQNQNGERHTVDQVSYTPKFL